jgi:hypothetical protein
MVGRSIEEEPQTLDTAPSDVNASTAYNTFGRGRGCCEHGGPPEAGSGRAEPAVVHDGSAVGQQPSVRHEAVQGLHAHKGRAALLAPEQGSTRIVKSRGRLGLGLGRPD